MMIVKLKSNYFQSAFYRHELTQLQITTSNTFCNFSDTHSLKCTHTSLGDLQMCEAQTVGRVCLNLAFGSLFCSFHERSEACERVQAVNSST